MAEINLDDYQEINFDESLDDSLDDKSSTEESLDNYSFDFEQKDKEEKKTNSEPIKVNVIKKGADNEDLNNDDTNNNDTSKPEIDLKDMISQNQNGGAIEDLDLELDDFNLDNINEKSENIDLNDNLDNKNLENNNDNNDLTVVNLDDDLNEFNLEDEFNQSAGGIDLISNLDNNKVEDISDNKVEDITDNVPSDLISENNTLNKLEDFESIQDINEDTDTDIEKHEFDVYDQDDYEFIGGARKLQLTYDLPKDFKKDMDGSYAKTHEYLDNYNSDKYKKYLEDLNTFFQEQKTKRNRDKFDYIIDDKGTLIKKSKDGTNKGYLKITPPKYENVNFLINFMNQEISHHESELRKLRNQLILNSNETLYEEFDSVRAKYNELLNQKGIFLSYQDNVNGINKRNDDIKKMVEQKYILRETLRKLLEEIKIINLQDDVNRELLDEKIKLYIIENNKINSIDSKIKDLKSLKLFNSVILSDKDIKESKDSREEGEPEVKKIKKKTKKSQKKLKIVEPKEEEPKQETKEEPREEPKEEPREKTIPGFIQGETIEPDLEEVNFEDKEIDGEKAIDQLRDIFSRPDKPKDSDKKDEQTELDDDDDLEAVELEGLDIEEDEREDELRPLPKPVPQEEDMADQNIKLDLSDVQPKTKSDKKLGISKKQASILNEQLLNSPTDTKKVSVTGLTIPVEKDKKKGKKRPKKLVIKGGVKDGDKDSQPKKGGDPEPIQVTVSKLGA